MVQMKKKIGESKLKKNKTIRKGIVRFKKFRKDVKMKKVLIILFLALILITLLFSTNSVFGTAGHYYVVGSMPTYQFGARGYEITNSVRLNGQSGCASFVGLHQGNNDWVATGFYQGHNPDGNFYSSPRYYYDRVLWGNYFFQDLGSAPTGQNHEYSVYLMTQYPDPTPGTMVAFRDSTTLLQESGYPKINGYVAGESESHDNLNQMNYYFWNMRYATQGLYWYNFSNTSFYKDSPYYYTKISDTEWWAKGNP
jgi:hypothetical protein